MADLQLTAQPRTVIGRQVKQLRNQGIIPVIIYGKTTPATPLQVDERSLERVLHSGGMSRLVSLAVNGDQTHNALIRSVQRHPVSHRLEHVDFYAVNMLEKQHVSVPLESTGRASGLGAGVIVLQVIDHVEIEALPADIPAKIVVDISPLTLERPITAADLPEVPGVSYLTDADETLFSLSVTREEVEEEPEPTEVEPEVVGAKGKEEEEEEE
ncbi:MAG: 50S ribosomal protein L25 [Chloroflexi bacterium]|nr:MAG: 50S ribosomal protein L25 [Chloroflexota bacterium]